MRPLPFRFKIALLSASISGMVMLGFGAAGAYFLYRQRLESLDTELRALGTRHPGWLADRANFERFNTSLEFIFGPEHQGQMILLIKDARGQPLYQSPGWPAGLDAARLDCSLADDPTATPLAATNSSPVGPRGPPWALGARLGRGGGRGLGLGRGRGPVVFTKLPRFLTLETDGAAWRLAIMGNDDLRLVVGLSYEAVRADLDRLRNLFLLTFPLAALLAGGGGWVVAGRALRPLTTIATLAGTLTARGLDQRLPSVRDPPEITRLVELLNGMMDRLEKSFRQATRFSADASHELKTPLAIMQAELENAIQAADHGSAEQRVFNNLLEEAHRLKAIIRSLLLLAQADAGQLPLAREPVDVSLELETLVEDARILAAEQLRFEVAIQPGLTAQADRGLLRMALMNVLKNAVLYNRPGGVVRLTATAHANAVVVTVCDTGPGIPPADQARLFERFHRGARGQARGEGLGLGLSLAREIVQAHGGELRLKESRPGHTCFELRVARQPGSRLA